MAGPADSPVSVTVCGPASSSTNLSAMASRVGASLTAVTVNVNDVVADSPPWSVAVTWTVADPFVSAAGVSFRSVPRTAAPASRAGLAVIATE